MSRVGRQLPHTPLPTERLSEVLSAIITNPSIPNIQTQIMTLSEDECRTCRRLVWCIEIMIDQREEIFIDAD
jgi:hypothetical protein